MTSSIPEDRLHDFVATTTPEATPAAADHAWRRPDAAAVSVPDDHSLVETAIATTSGSETARRSDALDERAPLIDLAHVNPSELRGRD